MIDITGLREDKRPQSSIIVRALLDRLEAAEAEALEQARLNGMGSEREAALMAKLEAAEKDIAVKEEVIDSLAAVVKILDAQCDAAERERDECNRRRLEAADHFAAQTELMKKKCDALRAKIAAMEQQVPARLVTAVAYRWRYRGAVMWQYGELTEETVQVAKEHNHEVQALGILPGAQNAPVEQDESVRKAWSRFSNALHRSPDAPYPGMSEAFEQHFSQSFTDRDWRAESGTWAAAWKAAKRHGAQTQPAPSVPDGWIQRGMAELEAIRNRHDDDTPLNDRALIERIGKAMLTAAPEARS